MRELFEGWSARVRRITASSLSSGLLDRDWLTGGTATPATPNWALALLVGLVVALIWPWIMGLIVVRRARQRRQNEIDQEVQKQLAQQQNNPPPS
jgi:hypothetical protein